MKILVIFLCLIKLTVSGPNYYLQKGPGSVAAGWPGLCQDFKAVSLQSPINIPPDQYTTLVPSMKLTFYNFQQPLKLPFLKNHYGTFGIVQWRDGIQRFVKLTCDTSQVKGQTFACDQLYRLNDFHFHWSQRPDTATFHPIQGKRYAFDLHLRLYSTQYPNNSAALGTPTGQTEIAIPLMQIENDNPDFTPINEMSKFIKRENETYNGYEYEINLLNLIPLQSRFWLYKGSVAEPNCNVPKGWIIFETPATIGKNQFAFRKWTTFVQGTNDGYGRLIERPIYQNRRILFPRAGRAIYRSNFNVNEVGALPAPIDLREPSE